MSTEADEFYSEERWQNWLDRIRDEDLDPEDEDSARLLLNLQDDAAIAVVKILQAADSDHLSQEEALDVLASVREIVLSEVEIEDEETAMLVDGVQTSLVCVFLAAEEYLIEGVESEDSVESLIDAAADAESADELEEALYFCARAGTRVIDGDPLDIEIVADIEYGLVAEWVNGLDSLSNALSDPEVIEE